MNDDTALVLRTCNADGTSHGGFVWPNEIGAIVEAPDWDPKPECGAGLHGLLDGWGNYGLLSDALNAKWMIVEVERAWCVDIDQKVKFPACKIVYIGDMAAAMTRMAEYQIKLLLRAAKDGLCTEIASGYSSRAASSGDTSRAASSGYSSSAASSGDSSSAASSGDTSSAASSGNSSIAASSGYYSRAASSGYYSIAASSGDSSRAASSGNSSRAASSGNSSSAASSGDSSIAASSGDYSSAASSGDYSSAASEGAKTIAMVAGNGGRAKAGADGCIALAWMDNKADRPRIAVGYVGEGIDVDTWYRCDEAGKLVKAES